VLGIIQNTPGSTHKGKGLAEKTAGGEPNGGTLQKPEARRDRASIKGKKKRGMKTRIDPTVIEGETRPGCQGRRAQGFKTVEVGQKRGTPSTEWGGERADRRHTGKERPLNSVVKKAKIPESHNQTND